MLKRVWHNCKTNQDMAIHLIWQARQKSIIPSSNQDAYGNSKELQTHNAGVIMVQLKL